jgi:NADPH:quinone reductase-like Zn-dependent oxidoreductase
MTTRRDLLQVAACAAAGAVLPDAVMAAADTKPAPKTKTLLILGGTGFIGPHLTQEALRLNWKVTWSR